MRLFWRQEGGLLLILITGLAACSSLTSHPIPSAPFFVLDPREAPRYQTLAREQDLILATCAESHTCDRAHFNRALLALYEDQAVAAKHFQDVIGVAPKSRLAASSQFWLELLRNPPTYFGSTRSFAEVTDRVVRDLIELEASSALVLQREVKSRDNELKARDNDLKSRESDLKARENDLKARDKKMDELTQQLDALKRIDQEMKEKSRPVRPPNKIVPPSDKDTHPEERR